MGVTYASVIDVANALDLSESVALSEDAHAGDTQINVNRPVAFPPGAQLLVGYKGVTGEVMTVQSCNGEVITCTGLTMEHPSQTLILDATPFESVALAASRMVDDLTHTPPGGWGYADQIVEIHSTRPNRHGNLIIGLDHQPIKTVYGLTYKQTPVSEEGRAGMASMDWDNDSYLLHVWLQEDLIAQPFAKLRVTVTYAGGYTDQDMPDDIRRSTAILAARLWKEKDSGYSDVIGNSDIGIFEYKKAVPRDVMAMLQQHKRVGLM